MKGLEISRQYYTSYGAPMIAEQFPHLESLIAVGLVGSGSECYGFDDEISRDHDFEPGFCLFIPDDERIDNKMVFALERAYSKLPNEFMGLTRLKQQPVGGSRHGVIRISDFYLEKIGLSDGNLSLYDWFRIPEYALAEATNGEVFRDDLKVFTNIRNRILQQPEDVRKKKLAGHILMMAQSGQYNYSRCLAHGETGAAQMALLEFVNHAMHSIFLLNQKYMPFYKWSFRALRNLPVLGKCEKDLEFLISQPNADHFPHQKKEIIENLATNVIDVLRVGTGNDLETCAYLINESISDGRLRNEHILLAI